MALSTNEIAQRLFKKLLGKGDTSTTREYYNESINGPTQILSNNIWVDSNKIPTVFFPLSTTLSASTVVNIPADAYVYPDGTTGTTLNNAVIQIKEYSLTPDENSGSPTGDVQGYAFYNTNATDIVPFVFSSPYNYYITYTKTPSGTGIITPSTGGNVFDPESGILKFYENNPGDWSNSTSMTIKAAKYIGNKLSAYDLPSISNKLNISTFTAYTATTNTRINNKVETSTYNTFVSNTNGCLSTLGNEIITINNNTVFIPGCEITSTVRCGSGNGIPKNNYYSSILGGRLNIIGGTDDDYSVIGGGCKNTILGTYSFIGGGSLNTTSSNNSFIGGGCCNFLSEDSNLSVIGGGCNNTVSCQNSSIVGGTGNTITSQFSFIGGGSNNTSCGDYSFIGGGSGNNSELENTFILGSNIVASTPDTTYVENLNIKNGIYDVNNTIGSSGDFLSSTGTGIRWRPLDNLISGSTSVTSKLNISTFNTYTSNTNTLIGTKLNTIDFNSYSSTTNTLKLNVSTFNTYTSNTNTLIGNKLNVSTFNTYTSSTLTIFNTGLGVGSSVRINGNNIVSSTGAFSSILGGTGNTISCGFSVIGGGCLNVVTGSTSFIGGGFSNTSCGDNSFIGGGSSNTTSGNQTFIGGGFSNRSFSAGSFIGGGQCNTSCGLYSVIGGGFENLTCDDASVIGGGCNNTSSGSFSVIGGGSGNTSCGNNSFIGGGSLNNSPGSYSFIGGGCSSYAIGDYSTVAGGLNNISCGNCSFIGGGQTNITSLNSNHSSILGGYFNRVCGPLSTVMGGFGNTAQGCLSSIMGGFGNLILPTAVTFTTISGGYSNTSLKGVYNSINNGTCNLVSGGNFISVGGDSNIAYGYSLSVNGTSNVVSSDIKSINNVVSTNTSSLPRKIFISGDKRSGYAVNDVIRFYNNSQTTTYVTSVNISGTTYDVGTNLTTVFTNNDIGDIGGSSSGLLTNITTLSAGTTSSIIGGGKFNVITDSYSIIGGGLSNTTLGCYLTISNGVCNTVAGTGSTISGGYYNIMNGNCSFIGDGYKNTISGNTSTILNGSLNMNYSCGNSSINNGTMNIIGGSVISYPISQISGGTSTAGSIDNLSSPSRQACSVITDNTYTVIPYTISGNGGGAVLDITFNWSCDYYAPSEYTITNRGGGYKVGDIISIPSYIPGFGYQCNLITYTVDGLYSANTNFNQVTILSNINSGNSNFIPGVSGILTSLGIYAYNSSGAIPSNMTYDVTGFTSGIGSGSRLSLTYNGTDIYPTSISVLSGGTNYSVGDIIVIDGSSVGLSSNNGFNDLYLTATSVSSITGDNVIVYNPLNNNTYTSTVIGSSYSDPNTIICTNSTLGDTTSNGFIINSCRLTANGSDNVVLGGTNNVINGTSCSFIGNGQYNKISSAYSTIGNGKCNIISTSSAYSTILGGCRNTIANSCHSFILGSNIRADANCTTYVNCLNINNIPTSCTGLPSGSVWSNGGVLNIV